MAEAQGDDDDIFVYMGGDQRVPSHVRRARIHKSVKIVRARAFFNRWRLISVEFHDGVEIIEEDAFYACELFKGPIKLLGVRIIKMRAFQDCSELTNVEFGDKLEIIEEGAFLNCYSLRAISMPSVRTIGNWAFCDCEELCDVECGEALRTLQVQAFHKCLKLKRISLPLKGNIMIGNNVFNQCGMMTKVDLVGNIHNTVASLHMESWRKEMMGEINRINQELPTLRRGKTAKVRQWMRSTFRQFNHYKGEHQQLLKEATTLLELALWKTKLDDNGEDEVGKSGSRKRARKEIYVTSGASIVIKNVLPFLVLKS